MTTMYAAIKWPLGADAETVKRAVRVDLPILALMLRDEHGMSADEIRDLFEEAADTAEYEL